MALAKSKGGAIYRTRIESNYFMYLHYFECRKFDSPPKPEFTLPAKNQVNRQGAKRAKA
jgi:hypothetical protein